MRTSYQCLHRCGNVLIAASGPQLDSFSLENGALLSSWRCPFIAGSEGKDVAESKVAAPTELTTQKSESSVDIVLDTALPSKKRKLSNGEEVVGSSNGPSKKKISNRPAVKKSAPCVISMAATSTGSYVVAVTGEDKTIRVFEHKGDGNLEQLSERAMPKRPCSLAITPDNSTIICADKFGDVYSLPLLISTPLPGKTKETTAAGESPAPTKIFVPSANDKTVHSQRNLKALENQLRAENKPSPKDAPIFEHTLLLGHVSMLTCIALAHVDGRGYIITGDRDEHIRISRTVPQAHVIENYCLGHKDFVSRLCIPKSQQKHLLSGSGDGTVKVWDYASGKILDDVKLQSYVLGASEEDSSIEQKLVISGIASCDGLDGEDAPIAIICEGVPAVFFFSMNAEGGMSHVQTIQLKGNPLDIVSHASGHCVVSVDCVFEPGSTSQTRQSTSDEIKILQEFRKIDGTWSEDAIIFASTNGADLNEGETQGLSTLFYSLGHLRKRGEADEE